MGNLRQPPDILHDNENKKPGIDGIIRHKMYSYLFPHSKVNTTQDSKYMKMDDNDAVMDGQAKTNPIYW